MKTKKMTVIEYIVSMGMGGAETLVKDYALFLDKAKFNVIIVLKRPCDSANYKILKENNIKIKVLNKKNFLDKILNKIQKENFYSQKLKKIIKKEKPNIIHVHLGILKNLLPLSKYLSNIKLFYTCHNEPEKFFPNKNSDEFLAAKYLINNNRLQLIALHKKMAEALNNMFSIKNTIVVNNGIDFRRFKNILEKKTDIRSSLNIPADAFVLGHIGRFHYQKNHEYLVSIFEEVLKIKNNAYLLLVGSGELQDSIEQLLRQKNLLNKIIFLENRNDVPRLLKAMDVFVFPSRYEGFSIVVVEVQAAGIPCVISDTITDDIILSKKIKQLSINAPAKTWADAILSPEKIESISYGDINNYDMKNVIKSLEELYLENNQII